MLPVSTILGTKLAFVWGQAGIHGCGKIVPTSLHPSSSLMYVITESPPSQATHPPLAYGRLVHCSPTFEQGMYLMIAYVWWGSRHTSSVGRFRSRTLLRRWCLSWDDGDGVLARVIEDLTHPVPQWRPRLIAVHNKLADIADGENAHVSSHKRHIPQAGQARPTARLLRLAGRGCATHQKRRRTVFVNVGR